MKEQNRRIFIINLILVLSLIVINDPFNAYPKEYAKAPAWLDKNTIDSLDQIQVKWEGETREYSFRLIRKDSLWMYAQKESSELLFCDQEKVNQFLSVFADLRKFSRDSKNLNDEEFLKEGAFGQISFSKEGKTVLDWEWGKCYRGQTDCLVRERDSKLSFQIPLFLPNHLGFFTNDFFLSDHPFFPISASSINIVKYSLGDQIIFDLRKEKEKWFLVSSLKQDLNQTAVDNFLLRIVSWEGEIGFLSENLTPEFLNKKQFQKLRVGYLDQTNKQEFVNAVDLGIFRGNYKLLRTEPKSQYIIMPSYAWEYFRFFDIKQLQN